MIKQNLVEVIKLDSFRVKIEDWFCFKYLELFEFKIMDLLVDFLEVILHYFINQDLIY